MREEDDAAIVLDPGVLIVQIEDGFSVNIPDSGPVESKATLV